MKWIFLMLLGCSSAACSFDGDVVQAVARAVPKTADSIPPQINPFGKTVETRFPVPKGYVRLPTDSASFAAYLRRFPLHPDSYPVHLYDGSLKYFQEGHCAVLDIDAGRGDLQQCADAVMRLRAEYLYRQGRYADIHFNFTNGFRVDYARWRQGDRIRVEGNRTYWVGQGAPSPTYAAFRKYLDQVFMYAGTASLERELSPVDPAAILPGDVWIKGGHPGHAVIVLDVAENPETGARRFLLAQSYMPAQEIHVLRNPVDASPWYPVPADGETLYTPEWTFYQTQLRRWAM